jgi:hypothetical protein
VSIVVDVQTVSIVIASASVVAGVVYYILLIRHQSKMRQTDLIMRLYSTWTSKEFSDATLRVWNLEFKDYDDFVKRYGPWFSETEVYSAFRMVCNFLGSIGILYREKLVDIKMLARVFGLQVTLTWEKVRLLVEGGRKQLSPHMHDDFEYLYNELKKREQRGVKIG